jgi:head-tail adaptor
MSGTDWQTTASIWLRAEDQSGREKARARREEADVRRELAESKRRGSAGQSFDSEPNEAAEAP